MNSKYNIEFICYPYLYQGGGKVTLFLFYPRGIWDEDKLGLGEALRKYPPELYNRISKNEY